MMSVGVFWRADFVKPNMTVKVKCSPALEMYDVTIQFERAKSEITNHLENGQIDIILNTDSCEQNYFPGKPKFQ